MCGIAGVFNYKTDSAVSSQTLRSMSDEMVHRGPDDEGFYIEKNTGLAFRRLSIIDLDTGNQPIHNEDKTVWTVFNGEIYNFVELRQELIKLGHTFYTRSDTEVIVHLYEEYKKDFPLYLNGMYAIALWDETNGTLLLVRDRPGIKPLYYVETEDGLMFASEIKSMLKGGINKAPDFEAIYQYLSYGYIPSPLTGFKGVNKIDAGHMLVCSAKGYSLKTYWDLDPAIPLSNVSEEEMADLLIEELESVLNRQTRSDVPLGIFLSGGVDSSLVASVAAEKCGLKVNAFTVGFEEKSYNELDATKSIAKKLGLPLYDLILTENEIFDDIEKILGHLDEPFMDFAMLPTYFVSKLARSHVKTVLSGEGGDELFGGYQTHYLSRITDWYKKIPLFMRSGIRTIVENLPESHDYLSTPYKLRRFTGGAEYPYDQGHYRWKILFDKEEKQGLLAGDIIEGIKDPESFHAMEKYFIKAKEKGLNIQDQLMYVDFKTFLQDAPLQKTDRMSMASSLEVRVPLLDNAIIDLSRKVPLNNKINGFKTKYILRKALLKFQPEEIAFAKKRGFTPPLAVWLKKGLKDFMFSLLSPDSAYKVDFLNYNYVAKVIDDHLNGRAENSRLIWALIVLVNWHRNYISR